MFKGTAETINQTFKFVDADIQEHELVYYLSNELHGSVHQQIENIAGSSTKMGKLYYVRVYSPLDGELEFSDCIKYIEIIPNDEHG